MRTGRPQLDERQMLVITPTLLLVAVLAGHASAARPDESVLPLAGTWRLRTDIR